MLGNKSRNSRPIMESTDELPPSYEHIKSSYY